MSASEPRHVSFTRENVSSQTSVHVVGLLEEPRSKPRQTWMVEQNVQTGEQKPEH